INKACKSSIYRLFKFLEIKIQKSYLPKIFLLVFNCEQAGPFFAYYSSDTIAKDFFTCSSGDMWSVFDEKTATILSFLSMTNVVRGMKPCVTCTPRTSLTPG